MKVLIVGAGMQGQVLTWNLGRNPAVTEIVVVGLRRGARAFVAGQVGNGKALSIFIDAVGHRRRGQGRRGLQARRQRRHPRVQHVHHEGVPQVRRRLHRHGAGQTRDTDHRRGVPRPDDTAPASSARPGITRPAQHRHGPGRHQHLRRQRLRGPRHVLRDPHQGLRRSSTPRAAAGLVAGDLLHRLRAAAAALRGRRVQARRDLRPPREVRVPRAVRPRHGHLPRPRRGHAPCRACSRRSSATRACATSTSRWAATRTASTPTSRSWARA